MPVLKMPNGDLVNFPDEMPKEQIKELVYTKFPEINPMNQGNEFTRGFSRGIDTTKALITEGVPAITQGLANEVLDEFGLPTFDVQENLEGYQEAVEKAYTKYPTRIGSYKEIENLGDVGSYIASAAGELAPQLGTSLISGGAGGLVGKQVVKNLAKRGGRELTEKQVNKALQTGVLAGTLSGSGVQNIPESYFNLLEKGENEPFVALTTGALKTGLDALPQIKVLERIMGPAASDLISKNILKNTVGAAAISAGQEAVTEGVQEGLDILAESFVLDNQELLTNENLERLIESGLRGAIGGGVMGGGSGVIQSGRDYIEQKNNISFDPKSLTQKQETELNTLFIEEEVGDVSIDDSILPPVYLNEQVLNQAKELGVRQESISKLDLPSFKESLKLVDTLKNSTTPVQSTNQLFDLVGLPKNPSNELKTLQTRLETINNARNGNKDSQRPDNFFIPGDNEIVQNNQATPRQYVQNPLSTIQTADAKKVKNNTKSKVRQNTKLPASLKGGKPRYKTAKLDFPSPFEKALYMAANKEPNNPTFKWLKDTYNLTDDQVKQQGKAVQNQIKEQVKGRKKLPETIKVPEATNKPTSNFQRLEVPFTGKLRDDYVVPQIIHNNLAGVALSPEARSKNTEVIRQVKRIISETAGPNITVKTFESLEDLSGNPVAGAQFLNTVAVALNPNVNNITETAYHEAYHAIESMGVLSQQEIEILDNNTTKLLKYFNEDDYLRGQDFGLFLASKEGRRELRANAFGKWATQQKELPSNVFKKAFNKVNNFIERLRNAFKGLGFNSLDSVFQSIADGDRTVGEVLDDINYENSVARLQRIGEEFQEAHVDEWLNQDYKEILEKAKLESNEKFEKTGAIPYSALGWYSRFVRSIADLASNNPFMGEVYNLVDRREKNFSQYLETYVTELGGFDKLSKDIRRKLHKGIRHKLHEIADYARKTNQKAYLDENGRLNFIRDGRIVRLADPTLGTQYMNMQKAYRRVLEDKESFIRQEAVELFKDDLVAPDFSLETLRLRRQLLEDAGETKKAERLGEIEAILSSFENMKKRDYVPHQRYGEFGITVRDEEGNQVAFYTFERGSYKKQYDKFQLEEALKELKEKYSGEEFDIIGGEGKITNLDSIDSLTPFELTHNNLKNYVDPRFLNLEFISSLLSSKNINLDGYETLAKEIYNDISIKGFNKNFMPSESIDGYSKDWNRVQHSYLSGAARHLSSIPFQQEVSVVRNSLEKNFKDKKLKARIESYLDYVSSPQEDMIALRSFNFLWTMGGNLSTAALQLMTLPTTTLGSMSQYSPNPLKNMQLIGKWFKVGMQLAPSAFGGSATSEGIFNIHFYNPERLRELVNRGVITPNMIPMIEEGAMRGQIRGAQVEDMAGSRQYETRSRVGEKKAQLASVAHLLGNPISLGEQLTRFSTMMATYDLLMNDPQALQRAKKVLKNDYRFQAQVRNDPSRTFAQHVASFAIDEAHAVFGKQARPEIFRSWGGSIVLPFMTYPQQALEFMVRMYGRGADGKRALATTLGSLFILSGLMGLPGAELLKEVYEEIEKQVTGSEEDLDLLIREKIYDSTGDVNFAKFITQGIFRGYAGLDVSRRIGLPIVGQDIMLLLAGIRGESTDLLGVSGSMISSLGQALSSYTNGGGPVSVASSLLPVAPANVLKTISYGEEGVSTRRGTQLVTPEDVTVKTQLARAIGFTSDQIASEREKQYLRILTNRRHVTAIERYRTRGKKIMTNLYREREKGYNNSNNYEVLQDLNNDLQELVEEFVKYHQENGIVPDVPAFIRSLRNAAKQRTDTRIKPKDLRKNARIELGHDGFDFLGVK